jgi:hypothetical protein
VLYQHILGYYKTNDKHVQGGEEQPLLPSLQIYSGNEVVINMALQGIREE